MNYTETETKVREATNEDPWGPTGPLMAEIAQCTNSYEGFPEVMGSLWKRMLSDNKKSWRRVYKVCFWCFKLIIHDDWLWFFSRLSCSIIWSKTDLKRLFPTPVTVCTIWGAWRATVSPTITARTKASTVHLSREKLWSIIDHKFFSSTQGQGNYRTFTRRWTVATRSQAGAAGENQVRWHIQQRLWWWSKFLQYANLFHCIKMKYWKNMQVDDTRMDFDEFKRQKARSSTDSYAIQRKSSLDANSTWDSETYKL